MAHCLACLGKFCVVCADADSNNLNPNERTKLLTLAQCQCVRCPQCDSANTVNRDATKSYYCHICAKNFCWSCHMNINKCLCYQKPGPDAQHDKDNVTSKKKGGRKNKAN